MCCDRCCNSNDYIDLFEAEQDRDAARAELQDFYELTGRILAYLGIQDFQVEPSPASLAAVAKFLGVP